ncbi:MAG: hypothetical protein ACU0B9_13680 [Limimaricola soesokkakensis]|uniref:hypothetical protein n=1 Tax=Limimaricola soesokkakensis TaxID=1343159 RepID=UPI004059C527
MISDEAGGIGQYLAHLGDCQELRWSSLGTPRLDATLRDRITKGVEEEAGQHSVAELAAESLSRCFASSGSEATAELAEGAWA